MTASTDPSLDADVVIVGAGAAGAAAALEVDTAGGTFVALDRLAAFGGTTATSGGGVCIAGTPFQRSRDIDDSPELALRDLLAAGQGEADEAWASFYFAHALRDLHDWLVGLGVEWVDLHPQENTTVPRWHAPRGAGRGLMAALHGELTGRGVADRWRFGVTVDDLTTDPDGRVTGVAGHDGAGGEVVARGRAVVLATGGFNGDYEQVMRRVPSLRRADRAVAGGGIGATGIGHDLLARHGASFDNLEMVVAYAHATPDPWDPTGRRGLVVRRFGSAIWVNRAGRRFHDESRPGPASGTPALIAQPGSTAWAILDRPMLENLLVADQRFRGSDDVRITAIRELVAASASISTADSPTALAEAAGIDPAGFDRTFDAWQELVRSGAVADPETGRPLDGIRPFDPPYYAMQLVPLARKNLGGVRTDLRGRVLRPDGGPIPGLYAAGELAGFGGGHLAGRGAIEGMMIGGSLFSGRVAGAWAAHEAGAARPIHWDAEVAPG